jgi:alcohol dehydrogenase class IV
MKNLSVTSIDDFKLFLKKESDKKILIICGKNSFNGSGANKLFEDFSQSKKITFYFKKSLIPNHIELQDIIKSIKKFSPNLIIALGGGSVLDYAKIANTLTNSQNLKNELINSNYNAKEKFAKLVAIPTTAGSGAEVTSNAVIYIDKIKYSVEGKQLRPDYFFLIPELVLPSSNKIKSSAGFDAIAQAIESLISRKSDEKSKVFAEKSLKLSLNYFLDYLNKPNYENTSAMCLAANLSGEAISISKTTAPHAVSYPFTALYNVSHGHAVSLTLNKFLKFNYKNLASAKCDFDLNERFKILFDVSKVSNFDAFDQYLIKLRDNAKLENNFEKLGIDINKNYSTIISSVNSQRLANNPVDLNLEDLKKIIQS